MLYVLKRYSCRHFGVKSDGRESIIIFPSKIVSNFGGIRSKFGNKKIPRYDQAQMRAIFSQILSARCF